MVALAAAWSLCFFKSPCLGDAILNAIGIPVWSPAESGAHITPLFSLPVVIAAVFIAKRNPEGLFTKVSLVFSSLMIIFYSVSVLYIF